MEYDNATDAVSGIANMQGILKAFATFQIIGYMYPEQYNVKDNDTFDIIIVGAGTCGSVIANRLTENNKFKVLLVEAGDDPPLETLVPGLLITMMKSNLDWNYTTNYDKYDSHRKPLTLGLGKCLGGCSSTNFMNYGRGNPRDYKKWADAAKSDIWLWKNVLPYFQKAERLEDPVVQNDTDNYGTRGNLGIATQRDKVIDDYLKAVGEQGNKVVTEIGGEQFVGYARSMLTLTGGVRRTTANGYLTPAKDRPNLYVLKKTLVTKILFDDNKKVIGIKVLTEDKRTVTIRAMKEVIVSAGAINSAKLLMLSGIGPKKHLTEKKIKVIVDLPVGEKHQDHIGVVIVHKTQKAKPLKPFDSREYPASVMVGYVPLNKSNEYPDYKTVSYITDILQNLLKFSTFAYKFNDKIGNTLYNASKGRQIIFTMVSGINTKSRGRVLLNTTNPNDAPILENNYFGEDSDLDNQIDYMEDFLKIQNATFFKKVKAEMIEPPCEQCRKFKRGREWWRCYSICMMCPLGHNSGTCMMGSVVDSALRVYGVKGVRVADASIMPVSPSGTALGPVVMIGEKISDIIKKEYS